MFKPKQPWGAEGCCFHTRTHTHTHTTLARPCVLGRCRNGPNPHMIPVGGSSNSVSDWGSRSCCLQGLVRSMRPLGDVGRGVKMCQIAHRRRPQSHKTHGRNTPSVEMLPLKYPRMANWKSSRGRSKVSIVSRVIVAYSVQSRFPRQPSQKEATTRKPTKISSSPVTPRLGAKMAYAGSSGRTENLRKSSTLKATSGNQSSAKEPTQPAEKDRRLAQLQAKHRAMSQKATKGSNSRGHGAGGRASPSRAQAKRGTMLESSSSTDMPSQGEVYRMSQRAAPRSRFQ
mmetsp:Transcript_120406/g.376732  ORF Transcript_120406/g.376732 Transcript_120406/m.376732 type:complete len:285 (-) Transcript_120406:662-1516(-)